VTSVVPVVPGAPAAPTLPAPKENKETSLSQRARVIVRAPMDVQIEANGTPITRQSTEQRFNTPVLQPGQMYAYEFTASAMIDGQKVTRNKNIRVQAGQDTEVDFTDMVSTKSGSNRARLTVHVPKDAKLFVDDVLCPMSDTVRSFDTPQLDRGRSYYYILKATAVRDGKTVEQSQRIVLEAGREVKVEFKDLSAVQTASR